VNHSARVHLTYTEPHSIHGTWTSPPSCLPSRQIAEDARDAINVLAGPDARKRRTWAVTPCTCEDAR
jgi:hypothetical protein